MGVCALLVLASYPVWGQTSNPAQELPGPAEPGREPPAEPAVPEFEFSFDVELPGGKTPPPGAADELVLFAGLNIEGATIYTPAQLEPLFEELLNKDITLAQLFALTNAFDAKYRADGYVLSFSLFPPQEVGDGVFTLRVVEGYVDRIVINGAPTALVGRLEELLSPVRRSKPLKLGVIERALLLANDVPGVKATGVLRPSGTEQGASDLLLTVAFSPVDAAVGVNNRNSKFIGPWNGSAGVTLNTPFGLGEKATAYGQMSRDGEELYAGALSYSHPIGADGLEAGASFTYSVTEPGGFLDASDVESESFTVSLQARYPVVRRREETLAVEGALYFRNVDVDLSGGQTRDRIRGIGARLTYDLKGFLGGASRLQVSASQGLPVLHSTEAGSDDLSRADAEDDFTRANLDFIHLQPVFGDFSALLAGAAQYSRGPLFASEEFSLGGARFGRGYDSGEISGEHGLVGIVELRYEIPIDWSFLDRVQTYGFYDAGIIWDIDQGDGRQTLASGGLGLRAKLAYGIDLGFEFAQPLTRTPSAADGEMPSRFFVSARAKY